MTTIGDVISRVRGQVKAEVQDAFMTDRYIYSMILKFGQLLMRRQDHANKLMKFNSVWQTLPFLELIDIDKIEAGCLGVSSGTTIKRTKDKLPTFMEGYWGPLIRTVSSLDGSIECQPTQPGTYASMEKIREFRFNNTVYYWFLNDHIYLPNVDWAALKLEGVFEADITGYDCDTENDCLPRHLQEFRIPEFLFAEIEQQVLNVMMNTLQVPAEDSDNKINIHR